MRFDGAIRCSYHVFRDTMSGHPCRRNGVVQRDKRWYCKQHDPITVAERDKARNARWDRKWDLEQQRDGARARAEKAESKIVKYAIELLDLGYDLRGLPLRKAVAALRKAQAAHKAAIEQLQEFRSEK